MGSQIKELTECVQSLGLADLIERKKGMSMNDEIRMLQAIINKGSLDELDRQHLADDIKTQGIVLGKDTLVLTVIEECEDDADSFSFDDNDRDNELGEINQSHTRRSDTKKNDALFTNGDDQHVLELECAGLKGNIVTLKSRLQLLSDECLRQEKVIEEQNIAIAKSSAAFGNAEREIVDLNEKLWIAQREIQRLKKVIATWDNDIISLRKLIKTIFSADCYAQSCNLTKK